MSSRLPSTPRTHRTAAALAVAGLAAGLAVAAPATTAATAAAPPADDLASRFTLAVLPDTQFYSRYSADQFLPRYGTDPFATQTKWLTTHADDLRIPFTLHLGDIVDRAGVDAEWRAANDAMRTMDEAAAPYSILPGNHDVLDSGVRDDQLDVGNEPFTRWFGATRAAKQSTYGGSDPLGLSQFHIFEAEGQRFMSLAVAWNASDATLAWAQSVLDAHPDVPVILTSHALISIAADQTSPVETGDSRRMWDRLIRGNDQIFLTFNGHFHGATRQVKQNDFGHDVHQVLMDYQMAYEGGNGYLGLVEFDLTNGTLSLETGSPWVVQKPQESLTSYDQPLLDGEHQRFTLPIDFHERFAGFAPGFTAGSADEPKLTDAARAILLDGFEGPDPISTEAPGNELDFVEAEGTLAHWRFNGQDGVVDADTVIEDIAGENDLTRPDPADTNAVGTLWEDVTVRSADVHGYSSDAAAVCFDDSSGSRFSYLTTAPDAPVNEADLSQGYTIETFVKMDAEWNASANGWSKALTRTGNRSQIGVPETRWDWTASPTALGISNLREFQYTSLDADATLGDRVTWSGEIMVDQWQHVAIVNDPESRTTTMYVDGAPVLRNATNVGGMAWHEGHSWILGADWTDDAARNGWHGCIGETRIIDRPTTPDEWLTQRADLTGFEVREAPAGELAADVSSVRFAGVGFPGAEVRLAPAADGMAARADLGGAVTAVAADGTWEIVVTSGLTAGEHAVELSQALGTRAIAPRRVDFAIAAAAPVPAPTTPTVPGGTSPGGPVPGASAPTGASAADVDDSLAATGGDSGLMMPLAAAASVLAVLGGALLALRRRRLARG